MKNKKNATVTHDSEKITIDITPTKFVSDPLFPWVKKATQYKIKNATTLFGRYVAFYSTLISSGSDKNLISTSQIKEIGKQYGFCKDIVENSIKELLAMEELIKVQRGLYMINPSHISGGRTAEASTDLIKAAEGLTQINNNYFNIDSGTLTEILVNKKFPGLLDGL